MPPAAGGSAPGPPTWKTMTPVGARSRAPTGVIVFPKGFQRGSAPLAAGGILPLCFLTFTQLSLVADDCKKLLVESHERLPRTHSRPAQGLGQRPQARLGHARSRQRHGPRPGLAESGCAQRKAELYLLEKAGKMPPAAGGAQPRTPDLENNDACWRARAARQQASLFSPSRFPKGLSPFGRRRHSSS